MRRIHSARGVAVVAVAVTVVALEADMAAATGVAAAKGGAVALVESVAAGLAGVKVAARVALLASAATEAAVMAPQRLSTGLRPPSAISRRPSLTAEQDISHICLSSFHSVPGPHVFGGGTE